MKTLLIISFDYFRRNEIEYSYSIASIMSYLKQSPKHGTQFTASHHTFNLDAPDFDPERPPRSFSPT